MFSKIAVTLTAALGLAAASPMMIPNSTLEAQGFRAPLAERGLDKRISCSSLPGGLTLSDCNYLGQIGVGQTGVNSFSNNGQVWIGNNGQNTINIKNRNSNPPAPIIVVVWGPAASWVNAIRPLITYSLPNVGDSVTISIAPGFSGALAGIYDHRTILMDGQVYNTWAEFTTQNGGNTLSTIDVSRLPNMGGNPMEFWVPGAVCHGGMTECAYVCKTGNRCYLANDVNLLNCQGANKNGFYTGTEWTGGCTGWQTGLVNLEMYN